MHLSPCHLCAGERLQLDGQENAIGIGSRQDILNVLLRGGSASASAGSNTEFHWGNAESVFHTVSHRFVGIPGIAV